MYHRFSETPKQGFACKDTFREQVAHIRCHYRPMTLRDLSLAIFEEGRVPEHALVLTIDDGYRDFYEIAYPILREYDVPATLFVTTGFINGDLWLWHDQIAWLLDQSVDIKEGFSVGPVTFDSGTLSADVRQEYWRRLSDFLLSVDDSEKHEHINRLAKVLGVALPAKSPSGFEACSWEQLREMEANGIEIGGHTVTHPSLGRVTGEQARQEIFGAMEALVHNLGNCSRSFCYPNGQHQDYSSKTMKLVEEAGFVSAVTAFLDGMGVRERYALRRHSAGDGPFQFAKAVSGLQFLGRRLGKRAPV